MKFVAIDFETANGCDQSICAAGVAVFNHGHLADSFYSLIRPPKGYGFFRPDWITGCHGIRHTDVYNAPEFPAIAPEIFARLAAADVVIAHNAQFDMRKLCGTAVNVNCGKRHPRPKPKLPPRPWRLACCNSATRPLMVSSTSL